MTSSFVSKAKTKVEANLKPEKKEKKKSAVKVEPKAAPNKPNEDVKAAKEVRHPARPRTFIDFCVSIHKSPLLFPPSGARTRLRSG